MLRALVFLIVVVLGLTLASPAAAFCRKTTASDQNYDAAVSGRCEETGDALPLYWKERCVELEVVVDPELTASGKWNAARAADIVARAMTTWSSVQCGDAGGAPSPLAIRVVDGAREHCPDGKPSLRSQIRFTASPIENGLLAVTNVQFDAVSGIISSARTDVFDIYAHLGSSRVDDGIERVVRHEMGHFLGLAHSQDKSAVMYAEYDPTRTDGLASDDVAGICDIYSSAQPIGAGCSAGSRTRAIGAPIFALMFVASVVLRRRRAARSIGPALLLVLAAIPATAEAKPRKPRAVSAPPSRTPASTPSAKPTSTATEPAVARELDVSLSGTDDTRKKTATPLLAVKMPDAPPPAAPQVRDEPASAAPPPARGSDLYVGARYRAFFLPSALVSPIAKTSKDLMFHSASVEADFRRDRMAIVPALSFADLSTGDMLVGGKDNDLASSFSYVKSDLKVVAASVSFLWTPRLSRVLSLELGAEIGLGVTFGTLNDVWVHETPNGSLGFGDRHFTPCRSVSDGFGCRPQDHASPTPIRVGRYTEPSFLEGGMAPSVLPWVSLPLIGVRARVSDDIGVRVGVGASFTGIWAGASLEYLAQKASRN